MKSDVELVAAAMAGGPKAFGPIVDRYRHAVFGVALARLRDFHAAEDMAQQVFVTAFQSLDRLKDPARLGGWLRTMTIRDCADWQRRRREASGMEHGERHMDPAAGPDTRAERRELREAVLAAIGRLSRPQRETVTLFYVNGYSVAEVAAMQEVPVGTVKARLHDARETLKAEMMNMVADVLKSGSPKEDLAQRVFELLSREAPDHHDILRALHRLGAKGGIEGFVRAFESRSSVARYNAVGLAGWFDAPENHETTVEMVKRGLRDPSGSVRGSAIRAALERVPCSDERKRKEFLPRIVELLFDPNKDVRRMAAWHLRDGWAADVPLAMAARALLEETNRGARQVKEGLLRAVLDAQAPDAARSIGGEQMEERVTRLAERLKSPSSAVRAGVTWRLLELPTDDRCKRQRIVPLVAGLLGDRAHRVRWRAAYELCAWAGAVPIDVVEKACRAEAHPGTRRQMELLLRKATEDQELSGKT